MPGDEGDYACKVWNQAGQIWRNFTVHIVDLSSDDRKSAYYDADQLGFKNNGKEELEKWLGESLDKQKKHSSKNVDESSAEYNNSHDYLNHLPMSDGSSNKHNASSKFTTVNQAAPYWTRSQKDMQHIVAVPAGRMIRLTCRANGKPEPHIMWHKDKQEIKSDSLREIGLKNHPVNLLPEITTMTKKRRWILEFTMKTALVLCVIQASSSIKNLNI
uniref:Ig-like domain-containing protein n=1 Tax=Romanomermis culicivorax TaxID=13658 RepID=A0A915HQL8_ROMCU